MSKNLINFSDLTKKDIFDLVIKSNCNLHNIKVNIQFYKDGFTNINVYDNINEEHIINGRYKIENAYKNHPKYKEIKSKSRPKVLIA